LSLIKIQQAIGDKRNLLKDTPTSNTDFRSSTIVKDTSFDDIVLEEPLHKMRRDTKLVIVDVPGINEAGTSSKYKDFVNANWHTFDIAVIVMHARQGVKTEEQHVLLKLVKENLASSKNIPVIVLSTKVDDPHIKEQKALLGQARSVMETLFEVPDRQKALQDLLHGFCKKSIKQCLKRNAFFPAVVPISAMHAFVYCCGSRLSYEELCKMDADFIHNIGKDGYGRHWHRFGKRKQLEKAFEAVSEDEERQDGVEANNFDEFVKVLAYCIGDRDQHASLMENQIDVAVKRMIEVKPNSDIVADLLSARNSLRALVKPVEHLPRAF
jgi:GTPase SAR1 family protein